MTLLNRILGRKEKLEAPAIQSDRPFGRYLRDSRSGILSGRMASLTDHRDEVRRSWERTAALALDIIQNSGMLKGACDQIIADTIGSELIVNPQPKLDKLGYDDNERAAWIKEVKEIYKLYAWNPAECDFRGKFTIPQLIDISIRYYLAYGEVTAINDYMNAAQRRRYGLKWGTKLCLVPPSRLVQDTRDLEGLYQGVYHDENGRVTGYLFEEKHGLLKKKVPYPAFDRYGRRSVLHCFDPSCATDVRGISVFAPAIRTFLQRSTLVDATLQTAILQNMLAIVLTSDKPSIEAFEAIEEFKGRDGAKTAKYMEAFTGYMMASLERAAESEIQFGPDPQVSHLATGEDLSVKTADAPGPQFQSFHAALNRDMARAITTTYGGLTMDYTEATYASTRMETSSVWPGVTRRRERIAAPMPQSNFEFFLDEAIATGRLGFKGGYQAFLANFDEVCWTQWQGPAKPTADDWKSARAASERIKNGSSSIKREAAEIGHDRDEIMAEQLEEHVWYRSKNMRSPYDETNSPEDEKPGQVEVEPKRRPEE